MLKALAVIIWGLVGFALVIVLVVVGYRTALKRVHGVTCRMTRRGNYLDNSATDGYYFDNDSASTRLSVRETVRSAAGLIISLTLFLSTLTSYMPVFRCLQRISCFSIRRL